MYKCTLGRARACFAPLARPRQALTEATRPSPRMVLSRHGLGKLRPCYLDQSEQGRREL